MSRPGTDPNGSSATPGEGTHQLEESFEQYFDAVERCGSDRCFLCRRTAAEVKQFFGFGEDGVPRNAAAHGLEDVVLDGADIMSYRAERPVCAVCQLNYDAIFLLEEHDVLSRLLLRMERDRDSLWPPRS